MHVDSTFANVSLNLCIKNFVSAIIHSHRISEIQQTKFELKLYKIKKNIFQIQELNKN